MEPSKELVIKVKFRKKIYEVETTKDGDVDEIQAIVYSLTNVNPSKQKLMFKGKILKPGTNLESFKIKKSKINMLLMGTPDDKVNILFNLTSREKT
jgi:ubiquitin carboxyl-terminal hydrolase 14